MFWIIVGGLIYATYYFTKNGKADVWIQQAKDKIKRLN